MPAQSRLGSAKLAQERERQEMDDKRAQEQAEYLDSGPDSHAAGPKAHKESGAPLPPLMVKCFVCILSMISYFFSSPAPAPAPAC